MLVGEITGRYGGKLYTAPEMAVAEVIGDLSHLSARLPMVVRKAMEDYLKLIAGRLAGRHGKPWPGGTGGKSLSRRSGAGAQSIRDSVRVEEKHTAQYDEIIGYIGGKWYLRTHEYGAVIRAKRAGWLTIPLPAALNSNGVPIKRRARDWADTFIIKSKKGNLLIFQKRGSQIVPLYVLKKSVRIPARLGMKKELLAYRNLFFSYVETDIRREFKLA